MMLYRPVGLHELKLIAEAEYKAFPPRLPEQPIFYPVLNFEYAEQIARDWNTKSNSLPDLSRGLRWRRTMSASSRFRLLGVKLIRNYGFPPTN